jgi:hypothetical protein
MTSTDKPCPICNNSLPEEAKFCPWCGVEINAPEPGYNIIPNYPNRTHGPHKTHFPATPRNLWKFSDLTLNESTLWTPALQLEAGEYDIALVFFSNELRLDKPISVLTSLANLGMVTPTLLGQDIPHQNRLRFSVRTPVQILRIGVQYPHQIKMNEIGLLLLPRLGLLWSAKDLAHSEIETGGQKRSYGSMSVNGSWEVKAAEFIENKYPVHGPDFPLGYGDHVAVVRLACAHWATEEKFIALEMISPNGGENPENPRKLLNKVYVSAQDIVQAGSFEEIDVPFRLEPAGSSAPSTRDIGCWIRTRHPVDLVVEHVRFCSPENLIDERYYELGGRDSVLGNPLGAAFLAAKRPDYQAHGWLKRYQAGAIYWSDWYGAHEVYGQIGAKFEEMKGSPGLLGFPRTYPQQVTSSFGTKGWLQRFEGYRGYSAMYAGDFPWGQRAYAVYGGVAEGTYFKTQNNHNGVLGFPISDEYTVGEQTEQEWVRRSDFEGGAIEWAFKDNIWQEKQVIYWPRPQITKVTILSCIYDKDTLEIKIEAKNLGGAAENSYISLLFPDGISVDPGPEIASSGETEVTFPPGVTQSRYGIEGSKPLEYPRIQATIWGWEKDATHWLAVKVAPLKIGKFHVYARVTMRNPRYKELGYSFDGDPSPINPQHLDQQGENVYVYEVEVKERPVPALEIKFALRKGQFLIENSDDYLIVDIKNIGTGVAKNITVQSNEALGGYVSEPVKQLDPGQSTVVELDIRPSRYGENVKIELQAVCEDQFSAKHAFLTKMRQKIYHLAALPPISVDVGGVDEIPVLERMLRKKKQHLLTIEEKEAQFIDSRNVPPDHQENIRLLQEEIEQIQARIDELDEK